MTKPKRKPEPEPTAHRPERAECYCTSHRECRVCLPDEQAAPPADDVRHEAELAYRRKADANGWARKFGADEAVQAPADDVRARVTHPTFEAMRGYCRRGTHSDWRDPLLHAIDQAERCAELERCARELVAHWRGEYELDLNHHIDALAELLGTEET